MRALNEVLARGLLRQATDSAINSLVETDEVRQVVHDIVVVDVALELLKVAVNFIENVATISILLLALLALVVVE